jgi:hypothetical protein
MTASSSSVVVEARSLIMRIFGMRKGQRDKRSRCVGGRSAVQCDGYFLNRWLRHLLTQEVAVRFILGFRNSVRVLFIRRTYQNATVRRGVTRIHSTTLACLPYIQTVCGRCQLLYRQAASFQQSSTRVQ